MIPVPRASRSRALLASAALVAGLAACSRGPADAGTPGQGDLKRREPARVRVAKVEQREITKTLTTTTVVESEHEVRIIPRAAGPVVEVFVEPGDPVEAGAVLAVLDERESQARLDEARIQLTEAEDGVQKAAIARRESEANVERTRLAWEQAVRDYDRNEKGGLISQQALDQLRVARDTALANHDSAKLAVERLAVEEKVAATNLEKAKLAVQTMELSHSYTRITSPIAGIITSRQINVGDIVSPSSQSITTTSQAFIVTDLESLRARFHRPQRELSMFRAALRGSPGASDDAPANGGTARAGPIRILGTAEALPGRRIEGEITLVSPSVDAQSGTFEVRVDLRLLPADDGVAEDPGSRLLPGMLVRLEIVTDRHPDALVVPKRALRREGEASLVVAVRDGVARRVPVAEGFAEDDFVEVIPTDGAALAPGESVVIVGTRDLEDGAEVVVEGEAQ